MAASRNQIVLVRRIDGLHRGFQLLATLLLCGGVWTCTESSPAGPDAGRGRAHIMFAPAFSPSAASVLAQRDAFPSVTFDHVHVTLVRSSNDKAADTTVAFTPQSSDLRLDLTVPVRGEGEQFTAIIDYVNVGVAQYHGEGLVQSQSAGQNAPSPQQVPVQYVGPGANAARVTVTPKTASVVAPQTLGFTASVVDAAGAPLSNVPLAWSVSDPSAGTISPSGLFTPSGKRATVTITARTPTNISDNGSLSIALPAAGVTLISGGGQSGRVGTSLPQGATVRVVASDGVGISGTTVTFSAPADGRVGSSSVVTDANGGASTSLTLATVSGPQAFTATAAGFSVSVPEIATPADPATIVAVSGGGQSDSVRHSLKNPFVAKVSDTFGNAVPNVRVTWALSTGGGQLSATSSVTDGSGLASVGYTLSDVSGSATITASVAGIATPASFTVTAIGGPVIALSATGLTFTGTQGAGSPPSQSIVITNGGGGTLSGLQIGQISYGLGATGWLQATLSGSVANPSATLTVQPFIGALGQGTYTATIQLLSDVATNSPRPVTVTFTVTQAPQLLTVTSAGNGAGTVSSNPAGITCMLSGSTATGTCRFAFPYNTTVILTASATGSSTFAGWGASACPGTSTCSVTMTQPVSVSAAFSVPGVRSIVVNNGAEIPLGMRTSGDQSRPIKATITADPGVDTTLKWFTGNPAIATVSQFGVITNVGYGKTTVTAQSVATPSVSGTVNVFVCGYPSIAAVYNAGTNIPANLGALNAPISVVVGGAALTAPAVQSVSALFGDPVTGIQVGPAVYVPAGTASTVSVTLDPRLIPNGKYTLGAFVWDVPSNQFAGSGCGTGGISVTVNHP